jgi:hypothetical protein
VFEVWWKITEEMNMKINSKQKNVLLIFLLLFLISFIYVPEIESVGDLTILVGWTFIWGNFLDIYYKVLLIEWFGLFVLGSGLFFYFKE